MSKDSLDSLEVEQEILAALQQEQDIRGIEVITLKTVDDQNFFGPRRLGGGCIEAGVAISLANGRNLPSLRLKVGDRVTSWNSLTDAITESSVCRRVREIVPELLVINGSLRVTPTHPVLVRNEWMPAADIKLGDPLRLASGEIETVVLIERIHGRFVVLDSTSSPTQLSLRPASSCITSSSLHFRLDSGDIILCEILARSLEQIGICYRQEERHHNLGQAEVGDLD